MLIPWKLRLVKGVVARAKDSASVNTTVYGSTSSDAMVASQTSHTMQIWVETDNQDVTSAHIKGSINVSVSPGDRVRVVLADPGAHVVGLNNETLQTTWKWKYPSKSGGFALLAAACFFAMPIIGLIALWRANYVIGIGLLAITAFIVAVPLGRNRQTVRELHAERDRMLSGG